MKKIGKFIPLIILTTLSLASCKGSPFNPEDFISRISFNVWDFLAVFLAFIILITVAFFVAYKPIRKFIKNRQDYVEGKIVEAESREEKSRNLINEGNTYVSESKKEANRIIEKAKLDANKQKDEIIEQARKDAGLEKEKARQEINLEIEANKQMIHDEIVDVALNASKELLSREVNSKDNKRLLDDFVNELNEEKKGK